MNPLQAQRQDRFTGLWTGPNPGFSSQEIFFPSLFHFRDTPLPCSPFPTCRIETRLKQEILG